MANSGQSRKVLITQLAAIRPEQLATLPPGVCARFAQGAVTASNKLYPYYDIKSNTESCVQRRRCF